MSSDPSAAAQQPGSYPAAAATYDEVAQAAAQAAAAEVDQAAAAVAAADDDKAEADLRAALQTKQAELDEMRRRLQQKDSQMKQLQQQVYAQDTASWIGQAVVLQQQSQQQQGGAAAAAGGADAAGTGAAAAAGAGAAGTAGAAVTSPQAIALQSTDINAIRNTKMRWKARFQQLVQYKLVHGHTNVPKSFDKSLHAWVRKQRINKQKHDRFYSKEGQQPPVAAAAAATGGGGEQPPQAGGAPAAAAAAPAQEKPGDAAAAEAGTKKKKARGRPPASTTGSGLSKSQVEALNSIEFEWVVGHQPKDDQWNANYQQLVALCGAEQAGGAAGPGQGTRMMNMTLITDKRLNKWIQNQRARRKLLEQHGPGKAKGMTWERVHKLDAMGFAWNASK